MKKHSGMRPHDIAILLKIASKGKASWYMKDLANELHISASEVSESINRSIIAGLIGSDKKSINRLALLDFLSSGLQYVYPQHPGALVRGMPTAVSALPLSTKITSEEQFVWPHAHGSIRGQAIQPLHSKTPEACQKDASYYELMALVDAIRVGKVRERNMAIDILREKLGHG